MNSMNTLCGVGLREEENIMGTTTFIKRSPITGRKYDYFSKDVLHLINFSQCFFYIEEYNIIPLDIVLSDDRQRPGKKIVMFLFDKNETKEAYEAWCKRGKEENKDE